MKYFISIGTTLPSMDWAGQYLVDESSIARKHSRFVDIRAAKVILNHNLGENMRVLTLLVGMDFDLEGRHFLLLLAHNRNHIHGGAARQRNGHQFQRAESVVRATHAPGARRAALQNRYQPCR
jgi:hypothetical protein